jgi:hypothetical protein
VHIDPDLLRATLELFGVSLGAVTVASFISRRRTLLSGIAAGFAVAVLLWLIVLFVELRWFARWG